MDLTFFLCRDFGDLDLVHLMKCVQRHRWSPRSNGPNPVWLWVRSSFILSAPGGVSYQWEPRHIAQRCGCSCNGSMAKTRAKHSFLNPAPPRTYHNIKLWPHMSGNARQTGVSSRHHLHRCKAKELRFAGSGDRKKMGASDIFLLSVHGKMLMWSWGHEHHLYINKPKFFQRGVKSNIGKA